VRSASSIEADIRQASVHLYDKGPPVSRYERVRHWSYFARDYLAASEHLRSRDLPLFQPWIHLSGHAVECAIKSFLCAVGQVVPIQHDIVKLLDSALSVGLSVEERDIAMLVHLNHQYSRDLRTRTRYKARYPTDQWEMIGGTIPDQALIKRIVHDFCGQAAAVNEDQNRDKRDGVPTEGAP
jgi:HEPN domain-containing protein